MVGIIRTTRSQEDQKCFSRVGTRRTRDRNTPVRYGLSIARTVSGAPPFEELEVTPNTEDKRDLIVTMLRTIK